MTNSELADWKVVHDGASESMIAAPDGRIFALQQLGARGGGTWGNPEDGEELCSKIVAALRQPSSDQVLGLRVVVNPDVPADEIWIRDAHGKQLGRIINLSVAEVEGRKP